MLDITVDSRRLARRIDELGQIGLQPDGGLFRAVYTPEWATARERVAEWMREAGLTVWTDAVGNLFGRTVTAETGSVVLVGSHIDTVKNGGRYDGALGILAGLEAVQALVERYGPPPRPVEVVALCEEEGSRFHLGFWGTRAILGLIEEWELHGHGDADGVTVADAMRAQGLDPSRYQEAQRHDLSAFLELHIEQGGLLEKEGVSVGIVHTITGIRQMAVHVRGKQNHAGTTPMFLRRDALAAAAEMVMRVEEEAIRMDHPAVATVGTIQVRPGAANIIPGYVRFTIDARHPEPDRRLELLDRIERQCRRTAVERDVEVELEVLHDVESSKLDPGIVQLLSDVARERGYRYLPMVSGAGHDSQVMARKVRTGMLFVPSRGGRSHSPDEFTPIEQIVPGVDVLAGALYRLTYGEP